MAISKAWNCLLPEKLVYFLMCGLGCYCVCDLKPWFNINNSINCNISTETLWYLLSTNDTTTKIGGLCQSVTLFDTGLVIPGNLACCLSSFFTAEGLKTSRVSDNGKWKVISKVLFLSLFVAVDTVEVSFCPVSILQQTISLVKASKIKVAH